MSRSQRILLVNPRYPNEYDRHILPVGLGYISEALERAGFTNTVVDMQLGYNDSTLRDRISEFAPGLLGMSMMSYGYRHHYRLLERMKSFFPALQIVVGGHHMIMEKEVLQQCPVIDFGVVGEGENTIVELCSGDGPASSIPGVIYREGAGDIGYSGNRPFITDYDKHGFPTFSAFQLDKYDNREMQVVTSRGCPYQCIYCSAGRTRIRLRSALSVADEFEYWYTRGYRNFRIADDNFTIRANRVFEICDEFEKRGLLGLNVACANGIRADKVTRHMLTRMKEVGFRLLAFGVEAASNDVLKRLKKGETIETIEAAVKDACDLGFMVGLFFLVGPPGETEADVRQSVYFAKKYPICGAKFYNIIPFPRTELYDWVTENNYLVRDPKEYLSNTSHWSNRPFFATPELSAQDRKRLVRWANKAVQNHAIRIQKGFSRSNVVAKFEKLGVPSVISRPLADLYFVPLVQQIVRKTGLVRRARLILARPGTRPSRADPR